MVYVQLKNPISNFVWPLTFSGFHVMVLLLLPKSSRRPNKVHCNGIQCYELLTRCLLVFNMGNELAIFITYAAMLVDGNQITNLLSIGGKSSETGPDPPKPAIVGGLDTHAVFEGAQSSFVYYYAYILTVVIIQGMLVRLEVRHTFH